MVKKTVAVISISLIIFVAVLLILSGKGDGIALSGRIAVIPINGQITIEDSFVPGSLQSSIRSAIEEASDDFSVKAIVLDINSPGGSPVASDEIAYEISRVKKPVIAYIGEIGASGGYYIASAADEIYTNPSSITCSIGVFSAVGDLTGFMEEHGLNVTVIKGGEYKDIGSPFKKLEDDEEAILQEMIDQVHQQFIEVVAVNRGMSVAEVRRLATGQPCTGRQAFDQGLVDSLGNRQQAIDRAAELGGLEPDPAVVVMQESKDLFGDVFGANVQDAFYAMGVGIGNGLGPESDTQISITT